MSSGLYCYRVKQDNFNLNNYTVDDVAKLHNPEKKIDQTNILFDSL